MSPYLYQILAIAASFVISLACVPLAMRLAFKIGAVDRPDERKVHSRVMPRLGGLAIFMAFFCGHGCLYPTGRSDAGAVNWRRRYIPGGHH